MVKENSTSLLASFATLKTLSDAKKYTNTYQLLSEFICYIIGRKKLHTFSSVEMKNQLKSFFGFDVPEAVVITSCKSVDGIKRSDGLFVVDWSDFSCDVAFEKVKEEAEGTQASVISPLITYIADRYPGQKISEDAVTQALVAFLVGDQQNGFSQYATTIGEFILKSEQRQDIVNSLNAIQEGSIWYIGINHNISETGSVTKNLTLYLGTEILFSLRGYNGEIHKQLADDFITQIKAANSKGERIKLRYFLKTKDEIDSFFGSAKLIREEKAQATPTVAMKTILELCRMPSDVVVEKADFYHFLQYCFGILEDDKKDYYSPTEDEYNLESLEHEKEEDKESWMFISHINKLRKGKVAANNIDSEYLYVTNAKNTLRVSDCQVEILKRERGIERVNDYAVSLGKVTNLLWYKLGNGFGRKSYPSSINSILRARVVLSSSISRSISEVYNKTYEQYRNGEIRIDQLAARIITLHQKPILPEELEGDSIEECMDFSPEYMSRYEEEVKLNKLALAEKEAQLKEKDRLLQQQSDEQAKQLQQISAETAYQLQIKDDAIAQKERKIQESENEKRDLNAQIEVYRQKEAETKKRKEQRKNVVRFAGSILWKIIAIAVIAGIGFYCEKKYNSRIPLYICGAIELLGLFATIWVTIKKVFSKYFPKGKE